MMLRILLCCVVVTFGSSVYSQSHWESIVLAEEQWRYFPANAEPPATWNQIAFDDSSWSLGNGGIGYGDGDDVTIIDTVSSLYLRKDFQIDNLTEIEDLLLDIDYDDGFVAYLNGVEIARSDNVTESTPAYNSVLTYFREAVMYTGGLPERYSIGIEQLQEGLNVLAIQVINYGISSSDLSSIIFLNGLINNTNTVFNPTPAWFYPPGGNGNEVELTESNLPIVVINTNNTDIPDDPKIVAHMGIINNGEGVLNRIDDAFTDYDGRISIELRGESAQLFPKKSYLFETQDALGENNNVSLLGMPEENDWILYAPYSDKSMLRNTFTFELGRRTGNYGSRIAYCELVLNGEYRGVYVLMEKIKRDLNRVNIARLRPEEIDGDDLTGGYILRVDKLDEDYIDETSGWTSRPSPSYPNAMDITYQYFYPDSKDIVNEQREYIKNFVNEAEAVLIGNNFDDRNTGYNKYLNVGSFVDNLLINEVSKEVDKYRYSTYFHKKKDSRGGELFAGPIWDFNLGYANVDYWPMGLDYTGWLYEDVNPWEWSIMFWWKRLMEDPYFADLVTTRWEYLRENALSNAKVMHIVDSLRGTIEEAQGRNYTRWPILGTYVWPNYAWEGYNYNDEVNFFKNWLFARLQWMDDAMFGSLLNPSAILELAENTANASTIQVKLTLFDDYFNHSVLQIADFTVNSAQNGFTVSRVDYKDPSSATLYVLQTVMDISARDISITIDKNILNGFQSITTNAIDITSNEPAMPIAGNGVSVYGYQGTIVVSCNQPQLLDSSLEVYNLLGQLVGKYELSRQRINTIENSLIDGIYLVRLYVNNTPVTEQIILRK
jgi:hypothetical protein